MSNNMWDDALRALNLAGALMQATKFHLSSDMVNLDCLRAELYIVASQSEDLNYFNERISDAEGKMLFDNHGEALEYFFMTPVEEEGVSISFLRSLKNLDDQSFFESVVQYFPDLKPIMRATGEVWVKETVGESLDNSTAKPADLEPDDLS